MSHGPLPATPTRRFPHAWVAAALVAMAVLGATWRADPAVAAQSAMYYMGGLEPMLGAANAARRLGVTLITDDIRPLDQTTVDDVGYMVAVQAGALAGLPVTPTAIADAHAIAFTIAAVLFAWALGAHCRSPAVAIVALAAMIALGSRLSMLIYGQISNQTATSVFPPVVLAALLAWCGPLDRRASGVKSVAIASLLLGLLIGGIDLIRHSHGLAVMLTLAFVVAVGVRGVRAKLAVTAALAAGYIVVTMFVPTVLKVQRDVQLGRWQGWNLSYLRRPPAHHISYTLLTAVGRYPNDLGIYYEDKSVDRYITARVPEARGDAERIAVAGRLFAEYVRTHPREYAGVLAGGAMELVPFLAYTTFMAPQRWELGWPSIVPGLSIDARDGARYGDRLLLNVRWHYLQLRAWQWALLALALAAIAATTVDLLWRLSRRQPVSLATAASLVYLACVALPRALIPVQGMDFVLAFWCVALLCGARLMVSGARSPLAGGN